MQKNPRKQRAKQTKPVENVRDPSRTRSGKPKRAAAKQKSARQQPLQDCDDDVQIVEPPCSLATTRSKNPARGNVAVIRTPTHVCSSNLVLGVF